MKAMIFSAENGAPAVGRVRFHMVVGNSAMDGKLAKST